MGKNKNWCTTCTKKHFSLTDKKFPVNIEKQQKEKAIANVTVEEGTAARDSLSGQTISKSLASAGCSTKGSTHKDLFVGGLGALGHGNLSASTSADSTDTDDEEEETGGNVQAMILHELQRMNSRLDVVEKQVAKKSRSSKDSRGKHKLSTVCKSVKSDSKLKSKKQALCSDESSDDLDFPSMIDIKSSKAVQKKIDRSIDNLDSTHMPQGNDHAQKLKSKRGTCGSSCK